MAGVCRNICRKVALNGHLPISNCPDTNIDVKQIPDDSLVGYMLEVDLHVPSEKHDYFNDLPFCPEKGTPPNSKFPKLLATLNDKKNYILHYRNLKQALDYGLENS